MARRILVFGATRGTGRLVVDELLARGETVRVAARDVPKARALFGERVEFVEVDLTRSGAAFDRAFEQVDAVIFTAAIPGAAGEALVKATEYGGVLATVEAAQRARFKGRLIYMTAIGVNRSSLKMTLLGIVKRNGVHWRRQAERVLAQSGLDYIIVRAARLTNAHPREAGLVVGPGDLAATFGPKVPRADVARTLLAALNAARPSREFSVYSAPGSAPDDAVLAQMVQSAGTAPASTI